MKKILVNGRDGKKLTRLSSLINTAKIAGLQTQYCRGRSERRLKNTSDYTITVLNANGYTGCFARSDEVRINFRPVKKDDWDFLKSYWQWQKKQDEKDNKKLMFLRRVLNNPGAFLKIKAIKQAYNNYTLTLKRAQDIYAQYQKDVDNPPQKLKTFTRSALCHRKHVAYKNICDLAWKNFCIQLAKFGHKRTV